MPSRLQPRTQCTPSLDGVCDHELLERARGRTEQDIAVSPKGWRSQSQGVCMIRRWLEDARRNPNMNVLVRILVPLVCNPCFQPHLVGNSCHPHRDDRKSV